MSAYLDTSKLRPVDPVLAGLLGGYVNKMDAYIAGSVLPSVQSNQRSGKVQVLAAASFFGDADADLRRMSGANYHRARGIELDTPVSFMCEEFGDEIVVDDRQASDAQLPESLAALQLKAIVEGLLIKREERLASLLSGWSANGNPAAQWDAGTADPMSDIETAIATIEQNGGKCNTVVFGRQARRTLMKSAAVLSYMPDNTDRNLISAPGIAGLLNNHFGLPVERVFFMDAVTNSASRGQTASMSDIGGDWVWFGQVGFDSSPTADGVALTPSAAARIVKEDIAVESYRDETVRGDVYRVRHDEDEITVQANLGYLLDDVTA